MGKYPTSQALEPRASRPNGHCKDGYGHITTMQRVCIKCGKDVSK